MLMADSTKAFYGGGKAEHDGGLGFQNNAVWVYAKSISCRKVVSCKLACRQAGAQRGKEAKNSTTGCLINSSSRSVAKYIFIHRTLSKRNGDSATLYQPLLLCLFALWRENSGNRRIHFSPASTTRKFGVAFQTIPMAFRITGLALVALSVLACNEEKTEDLTQTVNKNASVESAISIIPAADGRQVLTTSHRVWLRDSTYKTILYHDTLPALGTTLTTAENSDGDTQTVPVKQEYEIYITVK